MTETRKEEPIVLDGNDAFLDAYCRKYATSIVDIDRKLSAVPDDNPNKPELQRYRRLLADANTQLNLNLVDAWLSALIVALKATTHTIPLALLGERYKRAQSNNASKERKNVETRDGKISISGIIKKLAIKDDSSSELWIQLFGKLDELQLSPQEEIDGNGKPIAISFEDETGKPGKIKFSSFKVKLSTFRAHRRKQLT